MILRPYQQRALDEARSSDRPVIVLPTGAGKTVVAAHLIRDWPGPVLFVAHRRELIVQAQARLAAVGVESGAILSGIDPSPTRVQVGSVQTLARRVRPPASLLVIDEAHHAVGDIYTALVEAYPDAFVVGLTATPFRLDGRGLGEVFRSIVVGAYMDELVADGTLVGPRIFTQRGPDLSGVHKVGGDYSSNSLAAIMNTPKLVGDLVAHWLKYRPSRTVAYGIDVAHARAISDQFAASGISSAVITGDTETDDRDYILRSLADGALSVVSNCMVLTEGWDLPSLDCAIVARPTASLCLHLQMIGRIMRSAPGKTGAILLDHAGNIGRLGKPLQRIAYDLHGKVKSSVDGFKTCPSCGLVVEPGTEICPECGHEFKAPEKKPVEHIDGDLVEDSPDTTWSDQNAYWNQIESLRVAYGFAPGWAAHRFRARFGSWPTLAYRHLANPDSDEDRSYVFSQLLDFAESKGFKPGWAAFQFKAKFGGWPSGSVRRLTKRLREARPARVNDHEGDRVPF